MDKMEAASGFVEDRQQRSCECCAHAENESRIADAVLGDIFPPLFQSPFSPITMVRGPLRLIDDLLVVRLCNRLIRQDKRRTVPSDLAHATDMEGWVRCLNVSR